MRKREREKLQKSLEAFKDLPEVKGKEQYKDTYKRELKLIKENLDRYWNGKRR